MAEATASSSPASYAVNCVQAGPDIAGTGVFIGFMLPTYWTLIVVTVHYISAERDNNNAVDQRFINLVRFRIWKRVDAGAWITAIETSVLLFSDIQILTGLAILLCGYTQLSKGLSSYHWQVVIGLACFSSLTHLATRSSLRRYFLSRPAMSICRATLMGVILVLISIAFGTTGYVSQFDRNGDVCWPASSLFSSKGVIEENHGKRPPFNTTLVVLSIAFLVISYLNRVLRIFTPTASLAHSWFKVATKRAMRNWYNKATAKAKHKPGASQTTTKLLAALLYIVYKALYDIAESMLWEICWLLAALAWGSLRIVGLRIETPLHGENKWGFGQILPVLLTALPLWSIIVTVFEENLRARRDHQQLSATTKLDGTDAHKSDFSQEDNIETGYG